MAARGGGSSVLSMDAIHDKLIERARLEALSMQGIALTHETLQKIGIRPPVAADAAVAASLAR